MAIKKFSNLSNDIKSVEIDIDKIKDGEYEIESIIDVITDPSKLNLDEASVVGLNQDLSTKDVNRGDTIYITAFLRKKDSMSFNTPAVQGVLKLRVVDIFYGLQYLNKVVNNRL